MAKNKNPEHREGELATAVEEQAAKIPNDVFFWAALASMGASLYLQAQGDRDRSLFVGQWAAPFMLLGVYNKLVKQEGHDGSK